MKKIKLTSTALLVLLTASIIITSCKKNDANATQEEIQQIKITSEADAEADVLFNEIFDNAMGVDGELGLGAGIGIFRKGATVTFNELGRTDTGRCFTVTITPLQQGVFPKTVVVDFGTGCLGRDGRTRKGKISTVYTGRMIVPGSSATTTFIDHYVDSVKVEGTQTVQNVSTSNNRSFTVSVNNGKLIRPNGDYTLLNRTRTWLQTEGNGTPNLPVDDEFSITGNATGTVKRGTVTNTWSSNILQAIIRKFTCRWPLKGQNQITRNNSIGVLDYGNGTCDNQATFTINGNVHNITLR